MSGLFTDRLSAARYMKVKRTGITEILRRVWLFTANTIKSSESFSKQPTQLIVELNSPLRQMIDTIDNQRAFDIPETFLRFLGLVTT
jgi:hypothetical protein